MSHPVAHWYFTGLNFYSERFEGCTRCWYIYSTCCFSHALGTSKLGAHCRGTTIGLIVHHARHACHAQPTGQAPTRLCQFSLVCSCSVWASCCSYHRAWLAG